MATEEELSVDQGSRYLLRIALKSDWLTLALMPGYTSGAMKVRASKNDTAVLADLGAYVLPQATTLEVLLDIPGAVSAAWTWRTGVYDIEIHHTNPAYDARVLQGSISVDREVTR